MRRWHGHSAIFSQIRDDGHNTNEILWATGLCFHTTKVVLASHEAGVEFKKILWKFIKKKLIFIQTLSCDIPYTTYLTRIDMYYVCFYSRSQKPLQNQMCSVMSLLVTIHRSHWILLMNLILVFSCLQWFLVYASVSVACPKVRQKLHWAVFSGAKQGRKRNCCRVQVKDHVSVLWCWC